MQQSLLHKNHMEFVRYGFGLLRNSDRIVHIYYMQWHNLNMQLYIIILRMFLKNINIQIAIAVLKICILLTDFYFYLIDPRLCGLIFVYFAEIFEKDFSYEFHPSYFTVFHTSMSVAQQWLWYYLNHKTDFGIKL